MSIFGLKLSYATTLIALMLGVIALAACGGGSAVDLDSAGQTANWTTQAWTEGAKSGSYSVVAVDGLGLNAPLPTNLLSLSVDTGSTGEQVLITTADASASGSWYLHLQYNPNETHPVAVNAADGIANEVLAVGITQLPGVVHIGLAPLGGIQLAAGQTGLATVEFAPGPFVGDRFASAVTASTVDDLRFGFTNHEMLTWSYKSTGDYDQNSEVNIADITPIAIFFQATSSDANWTAARVADGDGNGEVNATDITPIAINYLNSVTNYRIKAGPTELGPFGQITDSDVLQTEGQDPVGGGYLRYEEVLANPVDDAYYIVVAMEGTEEAAGISNVIQYTGDAPVANPPQNLVVTVPSDVFHLEWDAPTGSVPGSYSVFVANTEGLLATTPAIASGLLDTSYDLPAYVSTDEELYFGVKADYGGTLSVFSNVVHYTPGSGGSAPVWDIAGSGIKTATPGDTQVALEWYEATEAVNPPVEYLLYYAPTATGIDWATHQDTHSGGLAKVVTGLVNDTSYDFGVRARNNNGDTTTNTNFLAATPSEDAVPFDTGVWQPSELVDDGGAEQAQEVGWFTDIEVATDGTVGIVHYNHFSKDLLYTSGTAGSWTTQVVSSQGDTGLWPELEFHPVGGHPCIAYHNADEASLEYAQFNGTTWDIETVDAGGDRGAFCSFEFDPADNNPAISYFDAVGQDCRYAKWDGTEWDITTVYNGNSEGAFNLTGAFTGLSFNPVTGNPGISFSKSYFDGFDMIACWYAEFNGSSWSAEEADLGSVGDLGFGTAGWGTSLCFNETGSPFIIHVDITNEVRIADKSAGFWQAATVGSTNYLLNADRILTDIEWYGGDMHWVYYDSAGGACDFGTGYGPAAPIESGSVGGTPTVVIDTGGVYHVAYLDIANNQLRYATGDGSTWSAEIADSGEPARPIVGSQASLAYDPGSGTPMVSYHDSSNGSLRFADKQPGTWRNEVVATGKNDGTSSQMGVDDTGTAFIAYFYIDTAVAGLTVADGSFGNWGFTNIQEANLETGGEPVGQYLALNMNSLPDNFPGISYYNKNTRGFEYALGASGNSYEQTDIDTFNDPGRWSSTAFNPANKLPGVAYYRRDTGDLFFSERSGGGAWTPEPVDTTQDVGNRCAMAYVTDYIATTEPWISYYDSTNKSLKVAYNDGSSWQFVAVPAPSGSADYGSYSSIANHPVHARPAVVFYDKGNGKLWYMFIGDPGNPQAAVEIAGAGIDEGTFPSLKFHPATNQPGVAYHDGTNGDLRYVWREGS